MLKHRSDYQTPSCNVIAADLDIRIFEDRTLVTTSLKLERTGDAPFILNGRDLTLHEIALDGRVLDEADWPYARGAEPRRAAGKLRGADRLAMPSRVKHRAGGAVPVRRDVLHPVRAGGIPPHRVFPGPPRCDDGLHRAGRGGRAFPQLLSNGNLVETGDAGEGRHYAIWHDPHPKPSYLFACVVGDLDLAAGSFATASGRKVDLHIYVEKGNLSLTGHAMESLKKSMKWDEDAYGLEYDLDLFQIVAVSHFNMGAMENKGLNIFNSKFVLADPRRRPTKTCIASNPLWRTNISITGPATASPAATGSS